jgi:hypothetical protein
MGTLMVDEVSGSGAVIQYLGEWPSFHDAEIVSISLSRSGPSVVRVYPYSPDKPATVEFILEDVTDVELDGFSSQNVIFGLDIKKMDQAGETYYRLMMSPCFGLAGRLDAKSLRVELHPGKSPDNVSLW